MGVERGTFNFEPTLPVAACLSCGLLARLLCALRLISGAFNRSPMLGYIRLVFLSRANWATYYSLLISKNVKEELSINNPPGGIQGLSGRTMPGISYSFRTTQCGASLYVRTQSALGVMIVPPDRYPCESGMPEPFLRLAHSHRWPCVPPAYSTFHRRGTRTTTPARDGQTHAGSPAW